MRRKILTKDCPSCEKMIIGDDGKFQCHWGNSKVHKILLDTKSKHGLKNCRLIRKEK